MRPASNTRWTLRAQLAAALLVSFAGMASSTGTAAAEIEIKGGQCMSNVHLVAHEAPLSAILAKLAKSLDFQLSFDSESDPAVDIDVKRSPLDVVRQLIGTENVSVIQASNPKCPDHDKIVKIWVLPKPGVLRASLPAANAKTAQDQTDYARKARSEVEQYLRPQGAVEDASKDDNATSD